MIMKFEGNTKKKFKRKSEKKTKNRLIKEETVANKTEQKIIAHIFELTKEYRRF